MILAYSQQAFLNLMTSKLRTSLATLGILVGTSAIVALISCSQLATEKALAQLKVLGTNLIAVSAFQEAFTSDQVMQEVPLHVWQELPIKISDIRRIAPYNTTRQLVSFHGKIIDESMTSIIGADEELANINGIKLSKGHFVSFMESFERFCVIGDTLAQRLRQISIDDPLGKHLRIGEELYKIIGVISPWIDNGFFKEDINQSIIIPIKGMRLLSKDAPISAIILLNSERNMDVVIEQIKQAIHIQRPNFSIYVHSAKQIITSIESQSKIFTLLLTVIGGISLLVGGIGVMNVMLISVSERKKEIGIRKALGARNFEIQSLFLAESILLSILGGVLGVIVGLLVTWVIAYFSQWPFTVFMIPILIGLGVSLTTGIFFGFYPARRAAQLQPMESLRSD